MKRPADDEALTRVRDMRRFSTDAEQRLWSALHGRTGPSSAGQSGRGRYVAGFYCPLAAWGNLMVGSTMNNVEYDEHPRRRLEGEGLTMIRFWNNDVTDNREGVVAVMAQALTPSPRRGEG